jgi:hypothetical protein
MKEDREEKENPGTLITESESRGIEALCNCLI